ncbi:hypothetical protein GCM10011581_28340 [Saccharopolyspora subtropica]|uniref:Uncharacterized protein n=1 Tax=Saccharopolyspora thermophila TaxID=89367 RepID=A0A917ND55_9PSEU|nr:hypothetical protein GCM10011581_28340 [Saccharopolyspora subtropica]
MGAFAFEHDDLRATDTVRATTNEEVVGTTLRGIGQPHRPDTWKPCAQRNIHVDRAQFPSRVLPAKDFLSDHQREPDAEVLGLGHLVVMDDLTSLLGKHQQVLRRPPKGGTVADLGPVPRDVREWRVAVETRRNPYLAQDFGWEGQETAAQINPNRGGIFSEVENRIGNGRCSCDTTHSSREFRC